MEGDSAGILRAGERENTDQAEKDGGNVIHQTNCGRKGGENTRSAERGGENRKKESRTAGLEWNRRETNISGINKIYS